MANEKVQSYIDAINQSLENMVTSVSDLSEETIRWNPTEEEWSILQILNHVDEATHFWFGELDNVLETPGTKWGRGLQHEGRLAAVANTEQLNVQEVIENVKGLKNLVTDKLSKVTDSRLSEENPHRNFEKFGNKPVSFLIEHFMVEHVDKHDGQIKRNLSKVN